MCCGIGGICFQTYCAFYRLIDEYLSIMFIVYVGWFTYFLCDKYLIIIFMQH